WCFWHFRFVRGRFACSHPGVFVDIIVAGLSVLSVIGIRVLCSRKISENLWIYVVRWGDTRRTEVGPYGSSIIRMGTLWHLRRKKRKGYSFIQTIYMS